LSAPNIEENRESPWHQLLLEIARNPLAAFMYAGSLFLTLYYRYVVRCVGRHSLIMAGSRLYGATANISIGSHCLLKQHVYLRAGPEGAISIGDRVSINNFCAFYGYGHISIGAGCMIAPGVKILTTAHPRMDTANAPQWGTVHKDVTIGENVWIGTNAVVLPGTLLGAGAIVGAGAVVTRDIPAGALALGVPARAVSATSPLRPVDDRAPQ